MTPAPRRWLAPVLALCAAAALVAPPGPAAAEPDHPTETEQPLLRDVLEQTGRGYAEAKAKLRKSQQRQRQLLAALDAAEKRVAALQPQVNQIAAETYRTGRAGALAVLLNSSSADTFAERAIRLDELSQVNDQKLAEINRARAQVVMAKTAIDAEVAEQRRQVVIMAKQKRAAEKALALVGGRSVTDGGLVSVTSPVARPAPRTADGGWPRQSCTEDDPTTSGCLTPRTLHAYKEVRRAGFDRFAGCYRPGGPYEHPKGRACDWSLLERGFKPAANDDQRLYGNNLAAFLVRNADRLGILYVIWYRKIWFPATGWKSYSGASNHTDHVHMSML